MSWQAYVDTNLVGSGKVSKAAILGLQGGIWAASPGYNVCFMETLYMLSIDEQKAAVGLFNDASKAQSAGVRLAGQKFITLQANDRSIYGKKQADGCVLVKTKQTVLVAEYIAPIQAAEATLIVETLADYLISVGF